MRLTVPILMLTICLAVARAQEDSTPDSIGVKAVSEKIAQKIKMVNLILNNPDLLQRVKASRDSVARDLVSRAAENFLKGEQYFDRGQYLEAEALLDYVLRDLGASSRLLSSPQQKSSRYRHFIAKLDAFALPAWHDLDESDNQLLQEKLMRISDLRSRAIRHANGEFYDEAISMLEQAYRLKASLIEEFDHKTLVVYDLEFDTVQEEYRYLVNRAYHFLDLVQLAMVRGDVLATTQMRVDDYVYASVSNLESAEELQTRGQFSEAVPMLENSIEQLTTALKLLGVRF